MMAFFASNLLNYTGGIGQSRAEHIFLHSLTPRLRVDSFANETLPLLEDELVQKFVIVRDPIQRILSAFADKCLGEFWV